MAGKEACVNKAGEKITDDVSLPQIDLSDTNNDVIVTKKDLENILSITLDLDPGNQEFQKVFKEMDEDADGNINFDVFLAALKKSKNISKNRGTLLTLLDSDYDGKIGASDWQKMFIKFGINLTVEEVGEVMKIVEKIGTSDWQKILMKFGVNLTEEEVNEVMKGTGGILGGEDSGDIYEDNSSSAHDVD